MAPPADSTQTGGASSTLNSMPTPAPINVSSTRSQAVAETRVTPRTSIALMATSGTNSPTFTKRPTTSATRMISPRLHQVRPTRELKPMASSTPATTEFTLRTAVTRVVYRVTCTTSRAVNGAVSGAGSLLS